MTRRQPLPLVPCCQSPHCVILTFYGVWTFRRLPDDTGAGKTAPVVVRTPWFGTLSGCRLTSSAVFLPPTTGNSRFYVVCRKLHFRFCAVLPFSLIHPF